MIGTQRRNMLASLCGSMVIKTSSAIIIQRGRTNCFISYSPRVKAQPI